MSYSQPNVPFDFAALDPREPEALVPVAEATAALVTILQWLMRSESFASTGAKVFALSALLNPVQSPYRSLAAIARASEKECWRKDISTAALSKSLLELLDSNAVRLRIRLNSSREVYRQTQLELVAAGRHASQRHNGIKKSITVDVSKKN
jgi:hypothetical protein